MNRTHRALASLFVVAVVSILSYQNCSQGFAAASREVGLASSESITANGKIAITSSMKPTVALGECSSAIAVTMQDPSGAPIVASADTTLSGSSSLLSKLYYDPACSMSVGTGVVIQAGSSSRNVYFKSAFLFQDNLVLSASGMASNAVELLAFRRKLLTFDVYSGLNAFIIAGKTFVGGFSLNGGATGFATPTAAPPYSTVNNFLSGEKALAASYAAVFNNTLMPYGFIQTDQTLLLDGKIIVDHPVTTVGRSGDGYWYVDHNQLFRASTTQVQVVTPSGHIDGFDADAYGVCALIDATVYCLQGRASADFSIIANPTFVALDGFNQPSQIMLTASQVCALQQTTIVCKDMSNATGAPVAIQSSISVQQMLGGNLQFKPDLVVKSTDGNSYDLSLTPATDGSGALAVDALQIGANGMELEESSVYQNHSATSPQVEYIGCGRSGTKTVCWHGNGKAEVITSLPDMVL